MAYNIEYMELTKKYNTLREQNEKLLGSIKILQATNEELATTLKKIEGEKKKYKDAFEDLFINNVGNAWELISEEKRNKMSVGDKINFFTRENSLAKLYIRDKMEQKMADCKKTIDELKLELNKRDEEIKSLHDSIDIKHKTDERRHIDNNDASIDELNVKKNSVTDAKNAMDNSLGNIFAAKAKKTPSSAKTALKGNSFIPSPSPSPSATTSEASPKHNPKPTLSEKNEQDNEDTQPKSSSTPPANKKEPSPSTEKNKDESTKKASQNGLTEESHPDAFKWFDMLKPEMKVAINNLCSTMDTMIKSNNYLDIIISVMGATGVYTLVDIARTQISDENVAPTSTTTYKRISEAMKILIDKHFVIEYTKPTVKAGYGKIPSMYGLNGAGFYYYLTRKKQYPVFSKYQLLIQEEKSPTHGEHIKSLYQALMSEGYTCTKEDIAYTKDNAESIADILAFKDGKRYRIEVEEGNYSTNQYAYKFGKCLDIEGNKNLIVVVPTLRAKSCVENGVFAMIREKFGGVANFKKAGFSYNIFILRDLLATPNILAKETSNYRR